MNKGYLGHLTPFTKVIFVFMMVLIGLVLALVTSLLITMLQYHADLTQATLMLANPDNPGGVSLLKELQIVESVMMFILPALALGYLFEQNALAYFGMQKSPSAAVLLLILVIIMASLPMINALVSLNEMMKLPSSLGGLEKWMKDAEETAGNITEKFLDVHSFGGLAVNVLMIAIIPALGEEMLFRGLLQRLFGEWLKNIHIAIFLSAFLFAAVHIQFYGLIPRMMLGVMFGYMYYWTGTLWAPIFAHFLNNGGAVLVSWLSNRGIVNADYEKFGSTDNAFLITTSISFTAILMYIIFILNKKDEKSAQ